MSPMSCEPFRLRPTAAGFKIGGDLGAEAEAKGWVWPAGVTVRGWRDGSYAAVAVASKALAGTRSRPEGAGCLYK